MEAGKAGSTLLSVFTALEKGDRGFETHQQVLGLAWSLEPLLPGVGEGGSVVFLKARGCLGHSEKWVGCGFKQNVEATCVSHSGLP